MYNRKMSILGMIIVFGIGIAVVVISLVNSPAPNFTPPERRFSLFFWGVEDVNFDDFDDVVTALQIKTIYVGSESPDKPLDFGSNQFKLTFAHAKQNNLNMYVIYDQKHADFNQNQIEIQAMVDKVTEFNKNSNYKIAGVAVDWEFHTTEEYKNLTTDEERISMLQNYVNVMKNCYNYSKEQNQKLVACIPTFYDKLNESCLEELIKDGCDYVQLMNYEKANMIENMSKEIEFAKKYKKHIETIAELQKPTENHGGITEEITFFKDGIEKCFQKFEEIDNYYNYTDLHFCYHYYNPVLELLNDNN